MLTSFPQNITWREPTEDDVRCFEGNTKLIAVSDCGVCQLSENGYDEDRFGHLHILIDIDNTVIFNYDGGGPEPWNEWTVYFYEEYSRTLVHAKQVAELVFSEVKAGTITDEKWDALGFTKEQV